MSKSCTAVILLMVLSGCTDIASRVEEAAVEELKDTVKEPVVEDLTTRCGHCTRGEIVSIVDECVDQIVDVDSLIDASDRKAETKLLRMEIFMCAAEKTMQSEKDDRA